MTGELEARHTITEARRERRAARPGYIRAMHSLAEWQRVAIDAYVAALNREAAAHRVDARERDTPTPSPSETVPGHLANNTKEQHD